MSLCWSICCGRVSEGPADDSQLQVLATNMLQVGWKPLTDDGKAAIANVIPEHLACNPDLIVSIGSLWYLSDGDNKAAAHAGHVPNETSYDTKVSLSTFPNSLPPSLQFMAPNLATTKARTMALRVFTVGGVKWKPSWIVGLAGFKSITTPIGDLGSGKFSVCDPDTGNPIKYVEIDVANPAEVTQKVNDVLKEHPGIPVYATGKWRELGLGQLSGITGVQLLDQADEAKFSAVCVSMFVEKILNDSAGKRVTVIEGGKGSTQISTIQL